MNLEDYILSHIDQEDEVLKELNRETHFKALMPRMLSGHLQGKILEHISKMISPDRILEIGTYTGYSAICLAKGLNKDGKIHTIEINDELETFIKRYFAKAGIEHKAELHIGDASEIIPTLNMKFDLIFMDADKRVYTKYYELIINKLNEGGYILADNILWSGKVVGTKNIDDEYTKGIKKFNDYVYNDSRVENVILPVRDGLMLIRKKYC